MNWDEPGAGSAKGDGTTGTPEPPDQIALAQSTAPFRASTRGAGGPFPHPEARHDIGDTVSRRVCLARGRADPVITGPHNTESLATRRFECGNPGCDKSFVRFDHAEKHRIKCDAAKARRRGKLPARPWAKLTPYRRFRATGKGLRVPQPRVRPVFLHNRLPSGAPYRT